MQRRSVLNIVRGIAILVVCIVVTTARAQVEEPASSVQPQKGFSSEAQKALEYVAQRNSIPVEHLLVANEFRRDMPLLARSFQAVTVLDSQSGEFYKVVVDINSGQIDDWLIVSGGERQAHAAKYGKLQPTLYEKLQQLTDTDVITVTIVLAGTPGESQSEYESRAKTALSAKYPEAAVAVQQSGKPMDVSDPALAAQIQEEYQSFIKAGIAQQVQPLVQLLQAQGFSPRVPTGLPAVTVSLSKGFIQTLTQRQDVATLFLAEEGYGAPELGSAIATNRGKIVSSRGFDGTGVRIAVLEDGNIDFSSSTAACPSSSNNCFLRPGPVRSPVAVNGVTDHATLVASAAASNNASYKGMAPGARILSAGMSEATQQGAVDALEWAIFSPQSADIVNMSYGFICNSSRNLTNVDWAFDYYARTYNKLIVKSAGNNRACSFGTENIITSPGRGWNVFTVGSYSDEETADWSDDRMAYREVSNHVNPTPGVREKPEVVAPGDFLTGIGLNGDLTTFRGTSFAAPQVAGLAALLIHRNPSLRSWPEALRAIIMATATNNIEGPTGIPTGSELKDGAGGINADLADTTATIKGQTPPTISTACAGPCWWAEGITPSSFDSASFRSYYFNAQAGDRIRVAIAWWSNAFCGGTFASTSVITAVPIDDCIQDELSTDLDLQIHTPSGALLTGGYSASFDNNYELVPPDGELILPQTGTYQIKVKARFKSASDNNLGVAWTKLPVSSPAVSSWGSGRLDVFVRGGDNALWHRFSSNNGSTWSAWESLGGTLTSDPAAVSWNSNRVDVFARGADNSLQHIYWSTPTGWSAWATLPGTVGTMRSGPTVSSWGPNRLDVFWRGTDNTLQHKVFNGAWVATESLGGNLNSDPAAVSWNSNRVDVFARGADNSLQQIYWPTPTGWSAWVTLPGTVGTMRSGPAVSSWGPNRLDVFWRGTDNTLQHKVFNGAWVATESLGGTLTSDPDAVSKSGSRVDVFAQGIDNQLQHQYWTGPWSGWRTLVGYP